MMVTESTSDSSAATVKLIPSIATDPLYTRNASSSEGTRTRSHQFWSPRASSDSNSPVPSTWPCTICPLSRPVGASGRSRLTREPGPKSPRLLRRRVSGARSAAKVSKPRFTAVRHTPFTAMLAPSRRSSRTAQQRTCNRDPAERARIDATVPNSSMMPVNTLPYGTRCAVMTDSGCRFAQNAVDQRCSANPAQSGGTTLESTAVTRTSAGGLCGRSHAHPIQAALQPGHNGLLVWESVQVSFDGEFIRWNVMNRDVVDADSVGPPPSPDTAR